MCLHSRQEVLDSLKDSDHRIGSRFTVIWLEDGAGQVRGYPCVEVTDLQDVANTIRNIQVWHSETGKWTVHLEHLNLQRWARGLEAIKLEDLPKPRGSVPHSSDAVAAA